MEGASEITLIQYLHHVDQDITLAINSFSSPASDVFWQFFSKVAVWIPLYLIVIFFFFKRLGWKRALIALAACVLTLLCCDQFANLVKDSVQRLRPCWDLDMVDGGLNILEGKGGRYGFFSAHAANAMGFAVCSLKTFRNDSAYRYDRYAWGMLIWALLMGISRVFVGKHFLGDVLVGFVVGAAFGMILGGIACQLMERLNRRER